MNHDGSGAVEADSGDLAPRLIELLIDIRNTFRARKDWEGADRIRTGLESLGVELKDSKEGTAWKTSKPIPLFESLLYKSRPTTRGTGPVRRIKISYW